MEQWQFLIQKEGERTWHSLEKPTVKIMEGRYRVVARSNRINTDVEVRLTHSSPWSIPPRRRIQKRRRRTNSEGLTPVIPFTYLKSGIWELQCCGDLMSDLLGASWQYTVSLEVIPLAVEEKTVVTKSSSTRLDRQYEVVKDGIEKHQTESKIKNVKSSHYSTSSNDLKSNDVELTSSISPEALSSDTHNTTIGKPIPTSHKSEFKTSSNQIVKEKSAQKPAESLQTKKADKQKAVSKKPVEKPQEKPSFTKNKDASEKPAKKLRDSVKAISKKAASTSLVQKPSEKSQVASDKPISEKVAEKSPEKSQVSSTKAVSEKAVDKVSEKSQVASDKAIIEKVVEKSPEKFQVSSTKAVSEKAVDKPPEKPKVSNQVLSEKPAQKITLAIIEQTASPLEVKGDTAEQILQNLIELALPSPEALVADKTIEDTPIASPPLPLLLTLDNANYVMRWGETINLNGLVELKETTNKQIKQISQAQVRIELRSPQNSELLQSVQQPNPNKSLPLAIASSIDIPLECSSKLILGEIQVYGVVSSDGIVELLASQSFTITADITELLAITVANPRGELDRFDYYTDELSPQEDTPEILEAAVSLDLELFNLVKTPKPEQFVQRVPSNKKSLPPRINPRRFRRRITTDSPKLPNVPGYQEKIDEYINQGHIETFRGSNITDTSFPYLRKLKALPSYSVELKSDVSVIEESTYISGSDNRNITETPVQPENISKAELVVEQPKDDNDFEFEEPVTPRNSEFIAGENVYTSPLIRKWMLSQGYSLPEPIDVEYEDYDISAENQEISYHQASVTPNNENDDNPQLLNREKVEDVPTIVSSNINIQAPPSPYFSISTSSEWEINQVSTGPSTQIAQEIVVDDTDIFADNILEAESSEQNQPPDDKIENSSTTGLTTSIQKIEQLPIPQLYIRQGELISGKSVHVRVLLPPGDSHLAVKLWLEDCQTRYLLDGPHLLSNLTPNNNGELEVITKLNIPFGCLEIRLEAIAINTSTQQESHKFTIQRTVIPPDLPNIQVDTMLGM